MQVDETCMDGKEKTKHASKKACSRATKSLVKCYGGLPAVPRHAALDCVWLQGRSADGTRRE